MRLRLGHRPMQTLRRWGESLDRLLFPRACAVCGRVGIAGAICDECRGPLLAAAGRACPRCAMPLAPAESVQAGCVACRRRSLGFDAALALGPYEGTLRTLCLRLKRVQSAWLAPPLMDLVLQARGDQVRAWLAERPAPAGVLVVPVPLHWSRRWRRRYDQAEALARVVARRLGVRQARALRRVRPTAPLAGRGRVERARALRRAFRVKAGWSRVVAGRDVVLVDDILTTGATCGAAARVLKRAGARRVLALVVGRALGRA